MMCSSPIALLLSQLQETKFPFEQSTHLCCEPFFTPGPALCAEPEFKVYLTENSKRKLRSMWGCLIVAWGPGEQTPRRWGGRWGQEWNKWKLKLNVYRWWFPWLPVEYSMYPPEKLNRHQNMKGIKLSTAMEGRGSSSACSLLSR